VRSPGPLAQRSPCHPASGRACIRAPTDALRGDGPQEVAPAAGRAEPPAQDPRVQEAIMATQELDAKSKALEVHVRLFRPLLACRPAVNLRMRLRLRPRCAARRLAA